MKTKDEVLSILESAYGWMVAPGEEEPVHTFLATNFRGNVRLPLSIDELALVDARLPVASKHLMQGAGAADYLRANWVRASLALWENGSFDLEDVDGKHYTVIKVNKLVADDLKYPKGILLNVLTAGLETCAYTVDGSPTTLTYCRGAAKRNVLVSHQWLDTHYPGWQARLQLLQALGESPEALAQQVLTQLDAVPKINLDGAQFDVL